MKRTAILLIFGTALVFNACQRHSVKELDLLKPKEEAVEKKGGEAGAHQAEAEKKAPEVKP